jgi:hypothetical protein
MDFILLLVSHGLRNGLFRDGSTLNEILSAAMRRIDRHLPWKDENLPLIPAGTSNFGTFLQLDKSATAKLAQTTSGTMGELAGIIPKALTHAIRRGGAKDGARLQSGTLHAAGPGNKCLLGHAS